MGKANIELIQGDCLEVMPTIRGGSVSMVLCDLPYGITNNKWDSIIPLEPLWEQYKRTVKENAAIVLFGSGMFTANLMTSNPSMWKYNLVWEKTSPSGFLNAKKMPMRSHEDIMVFYESQPTYHPQMRKAVRKVSAAHHKVTAKKTDNYGEYSTNTGYDSTERYPTSVLRFPKDVQKSAIHPTQKPVALLEYLIRTYTDEGDVVLDNCMGSGSTGIACMNTGRDFIGIELDPEYFGAASERISNHKVPSKLFPII